MKVLGIETSCDETGVAVYDSERGLLGHSVYSQIPLHAEFGGVVPELASRDHVRKLAPMLRAQLRDLGLDGTEIHGVGYTAGPGLAGALLVGAAFARSLAWAWDVPAIGIHHMEGHLLAPMLEAMTPVNRLPRTLPRMPMLVNSGNNRFAWRVSQTSPAAVHNNVPNTTAIP